MSGTVTVKLVCGKDLKKQKKLTQNYPAYYLGVNFLFIMMELLQFVVEIQIVK